MFDWLRASQGQPTPSTEGGSSGYLSAPAATLDPDLFEGMVMRPEVRGFIVRTLRTALLNMGLKDIDRWLYLWVIGSSMSYQWAEQRGHGDIDVTFSADMVKFGQANPDYDSMADADIATLVKQYLRDNVAPGTAHKMFGGHAYEVTFFWNPDVVNGDLSRIHPYAAYDLLKNTWAVKPIEVPADPASQYPKAWFERAQTDTSYTAQLTDRYRRHLRELSAAPAGSPGHVNAGAALNLVGAQAQALYDGLHHGRYIAFQGGGEGYGDWNNFRWQMAKGSGTIKALTAITGVRSRAGEQTEQELYGAKLAPAEELVRRAVSQQRKPL